MLFDTHAHYDNERFDDDRDEIMQQISESDVKIILNPAVDIKSSNKIVELAKKYEFLHAAVGVHPHCAFTEDTLLDQLEELCSTKKENKIVAIGEVGLDYFYDYRDKQTQKECFAMQIGFAKMAKLPLIIHNRDSHKDMLDIIKSQKACEAGGVFHCFSGSVEIAREVLNQGFYISFAGPLTFKNAKRAIEVAKFVPDDRILIETDSPFLTPEPHRGKRNSSEYLSIIAKKLAEIKNSSYDYILDITTNNGKKLFEIV